MKNKNAMKYWTKLPGIIILIILLMTLTFSCDDDKNNNDDNVVTNYSGTYYVTLAGQPRWIMNINHVDNNATFTITGEYTIEGEGTVDGNTMNLTGEINVFGTTATVIIVISFTEDGQTFSGTGNLETTPPADGTITGTQTPWDSYDVDTNGIPKFISTNVIELEKISVISRFRSGFGHDYSDDFESCRSMKHYFVPKNNIDRSSMKIFSPVNGVVISATNEYSEDSSFKGTMVGIRSNDYPSFNVIIFHIDLIAPLNLGDTVTAGQLLGYPTDYENVTASDTAVGVVTPSGYKLVSYFEVMTDSLFQEYQARGINSRTDLIISREERDSDPLTCDGEEFVDEGNLENYVTLN